MALAHLLRTDGGAWNPRQAQVAWVSTAGFLSSGSAPGRISALADSKRKCWPRLSRLVRCRGPPIRKTAETRFASFSCRSLPAPREQPMVCSAEGDRRRDVLITTLLFGAAPCSASVYIRMEATAGNISVACLPILRADLQPETSGPCRALNPVKPLLTAAVTPLPAGKLHL